MLASTSIGSVVVGLAGVAVVAVVVVVVTVAGVAAVVEVVVVVEVVGAGVVDVVGTVEVSSPFVSLASVLIAAGFAAFCALMRFVIAWNFYLLDYSGNLVRSDQFTSGITASIKLKLSTNLCSVPSSPILISASVYCSPFCRMLSRAAGGTRAPFIFDWEM